MDPLPLILNIAITVGIVGIVVYWVRRFAAKHGKAPHPIDHDTHYADGDGNVQDQRQGVHRFSAGKGRSYVAGSGEINRRRWAEWGNIRRPVLRLRVSPPTTPTIAPARDLFEIPDDVTYLNCTNIEPHLFSTTTAGLEAVRGKATPWTLSAPE